MGAPPMPVQSRTANQESFMANQTPLRPALAAAPERKTQVDRAVLAWAEAGFDEAVLAYRANPSADNWTVMRRAMLVYQQYRGASAGDKANLFAALAGTPFAQWDEAIVATTTGVSIAQALEGSGS